MRSLAPLLATALLLASSASRPRADVASPPATRAAVVRDTLHGVVVEDPYRWLEDKDAPDTRAWVREQMAFTQQQLGKVPGRDLVRAMLARYSKIDTRTQPSAHAGRLFFTARRADEQQAELMMRETSNGPDVVLFDPNPLSADHTQSVSLVDVSPDGKLIAFAVRKGGEDEIDVRLMDPATREERPSGLPKARYFGVAITADRKGCFYGRWEPKGSRVWFHRFGDDASRDRMIFGEGLGPTDIPTVVLSEDGKWLAIVQFKGASSTDTRVFVRPAASDGPFASVTDTLHALVNVAFAGDRMVIRTNWKAPHCRLMVTDLKSPGLANWRELVPERQDAELESFSPACGRVFVKYLHDVNTELASYGLDGKPLGTIALPGLGNANAPAGEWTGHEAFYTFASFNRPGTIYRWDESGAKPAEWWRSPAPLDPERYDVKQVWFESKDGTRVPMFVVASKDIALDGSHPVLLTGYGGFNVSETPSFSARVAAWLEMGGVFALANLRGGAEFGEKWHDDGMLANKQHTFDDFEAAGQWLIDHKYCTANSLGIMGGSNGGLLVGAAMTQRPELWGAVLCEVPLLDMLRYQRFLVARFWTPEYGSAEDATQFQWLRAYSPYQNVKTGVAYPSVMFVSGDSDTRVDPLHARKMAALMQSLNGPNPVLLHYDVNSGHSGGKSVDAGIEDTADELQFLRWRLGMTALPPN